MGKSMDVSFHSDNLLLVNAFLGVVIFPALASKTPYVDEFVRLVIIALKGLARTREYIEVFTRLKNAIQDLIKLVS